MLTVYQYKLLYHNQFTRSTIMLTLTYSKRFISLLSFPLSVTGKISRCFINSLQQFSLNAFKDFIRDSS